MRFPFETQPAAFIARPNRFLILARLAGTGEVVGAHCPDPGRLRELLIPGVTVHVSPAPEGDARSTTHTVRFVAAPVSGALVSLDTMLANRLFREALDAGRLAPFVGNTGVRAEVPITGPRTGRVHSRIDFAIRLPDGAECWAEVKSVTLVEGGVALFPDAVTARGRRHVEELAARVRAGERAAVCFVVQRGDAAAVRPNAERDPAFTRALAEGAASGLECRAWSAEITSVRAEIVREIPVLL